MGRDNTFGARCDRHGQLARSCSECDHEEDKEQLAGLLRDAWVEIREHEREYQHRTDTALLERIERVLAQYPEHK